MPDQTLTRTFDTDRPVELVVVNGGGSVTVTAAETDRATVVVTGADAEATTVEHRDERIVVAAPRRRSRPENRLTMEVTVPAGSSAAVKVGSAGVTTYGDLAALQVRSGSGEVSVAEVHDAHLSSGSGAIHVGRSSGAVRAKTGSGEVVLAAPGGRTVVSSGSGSVRIGRLGSAVRVKTGSGDVSVGVPSGVPVWTDLTTGSGRVTSQVVGQGAPQDGADHLELRVSTGSGDVALVEAPQPFIATPSRQ